MDKNQSTYGIKGTELVDSEWFWQEVKLRANNNYGEWTTKDEAEALVKRAYNEIVDEAGGELKISAHDYTENIVEIMHGMMEGLEPGDKKIEELNTAKKNVLWLLENSEGLVDMHGLSYWAGVVERLRTEIKESL